MFSILTYAQLTHRTCNTYMCNVFSIYIRHSFELFLPIYSFCLLSFPECAYNNLRKKKKQEFHLMPSPTPFFLFPFFPFFLFSFLEYAPLNVTEKSMARLRNVLKPFFRRYDCDGNGNLDRHELSAVFLDLGGNTII